jgi:hypothetical protein
MRMNFFAFLFLAFLIIPFIIISCTRSLTSLVGPVPKQFNATQLTQRSGDLTGRPTSISQRPIEQSEGKCFEGCCICGEKPIGHLFVLHDRSYRLCRRHLSEVPKLIDSALKRIPNTFFALTLHDPDAIVEVAKAIR